MSDRTRGKETAKSAAKPARKKIRAPYQLKNYHAELNNIAPVGFFALNDEAQILDVNQIGADLLGVKPDKLVKRKLKQFVASADKRRWDSHFSSVLKQDEKQDCNLILRRDDGSTFSARLCSIRVKTGTGTYAALTVISDISSQILVEEQAQIALEKYRILFESFPLGISITDNAGNLIESNKESERLLGIKRNTQLKRKYDGREWQIVRPDGTPMPPDEYASVRALKENRRIENVEMGIVKNGNEITWINVTAEPIPLENFGVAITYGDISTRKMLEKNLEKERRDFKLIVDSSPIIIFYKDLEGRFIRLNKTFADALNMSEDQLLEKTVFDIYPAPMAQAMTDDDQAVFKSGLPKLNIVEQYESASGTRWVQTDKVPILDENGAAAGLLGFAQDITERKRAEEELKASEKHVRTKLDAILSPQGDVGKLELKDILDIPAIQSIMDDFYKLTNVSAWILDIEGNILISTGWQDICTQFHRANPETCKNCIESDTQLSEGVAPGTFKMYKCKNNMWDLVTPIFVGEQHVGNLFLGQFLFDEESLDYESFRSKARRYGFNEDEYLAALERVPRLSKDKVNSAMDFYSKFALMISTLSYSNIALARSLTEKNRLLSALQTSEAQYRLLSDHITDTVLLLDMNLKSTYTSPSLQKARGFTPLEIKEIPIEKQMTPGSLKLAADLFLEEIPRIVADPDYNPVRTLELEVYRKDGTTLWSENKFSVIRDESGRAVSIMAESRDITDRKLAQLALEESEERYRTLFDKAPVGIALTTIEGTVIELNEAQAKMLGYAVEELRGKNAVEYYVNPGQRKEMIETFQKHGKLRDIEVELRSKDGSIITEILNFDNVQIGGSGFMFITGRDVTGLRQAEKSMRESEAQYRLLAEHTTDFVWLMDLNLTPTYQSPSAEKLTGFTHEELMTLPIEKRIAPASLESAADMFLNQLPRIVEDPDYNPVGTLELEILRKDGSTLWSENKFSVIRDEKGRAVAILGEARDITKRRDAEKKLEQTLAALEKTLSDTVIAISKMVEMKDPFTAGHQIRVAQLATAIAKEMNMPDEQVTLINTAAIIHDIGKIYVPSDILSKPGKLGALEYEIIQTHVKGSYEILKEINFSGPIAQIAYQHHERMDGSGYPRGLKSPEILPEAKILIVADVVEAMSSHRPYRAAMGIEKALEEITRNRGKLYDEAAVDACLELFRNGKFEFKPV